MYGVILLCSEIRRGKKEAEDNLESYVLGRLGDPIKLGPYVHSHSDIAPCDKWLHFDRLSTFFK